jgi:hypothetical protein
VVHEVREDVAMLLVRLAWPEAVRWRQRRAVELRGGGDGGNEKRHGELTYI